MWGFACLKCVCFVKVGKPCHKYEAHGPSGILCEYIFFLDVNPEPGVEARLVQDYAWCHWEAQGSWKPAMQNSVEFMLGLEVLSVLTQSLWFSIAWHKQGLLAAASLLVPGNGPDRLWCSLYVLSSHRCPQITTDVGSSAAAFRVIAQQCKRAACTTNGTSRILGWAWAPVLLPSCFSEKKKKTTSVLHSPAGSEPFDFEP